MAGIGMLVVFMELIILALIIMLMGKVVSSIAGKKGNAAPAAKAAPAAAPAPKAAAPAAAAAVQPGVLRTRSKTTPFRIQDFHNGDNSYVKPSLRGRSASRKPQIMLISV